MSTTWVQMMTVPSWEQLAIVDFTSPRLGAHATSRTQSTCLDRGGKQSSFQLPFKNFQTLTVLSQPPETSFCTGPGSAPTREPGALAGAQETDVTPTGWACSILAFSHDPSTFWVKTEIVPSDDPQARHSPNSCGAQQMLFTDDSCSWNTCGNTPILISQIRFFFLNLISYIHFYRMNSSLQNQGDKFYTPQYTFKKPYSLVSQMHQKVTS